MTEIQALKAAGKFTDDVMVDYSRAGQPLFLTHNPAGQMVGKLIAPYASFKYSHYGHMALALQAIKQNPANARAILPFVQMQAMNALFAGRSPAAE